MKNNYLKSALLLTLMVLTWASFCTHANAQCPTVTVNPATNPSGWVAGTPITNITYVGVPSSAYTFTHTVLPNGITLTPAGVLSGTPTTSGTGTYTITATDGNNCSGNRIYAFTVTCPSVSITPANMSFINIRQNVLMTPVTIVPTGGIAPYTFTVVGSPTFVSSLPGGITLGLNTGEFSGTPSNLGGVTCLVRIIDAAGCVNERVYNFQVFRPCTGNIQIAPSIALPAVIVNALITPIEVTSTGGVSIFPLQPNNVGYTYTITAGALPTGLNLNISTAPATLNMWLISGTPTVSGTFTFTVTSTDGTGCTGTRSYTLIVRTTPCPAITIPGVSPIVFIVGTVITNVNMSATGGLAPYTYDIVGGSYGGTLPNGLIFTNGVISGTPIAGSIRSSDNIIIRVIDANGCVATVTYQFFGNAASCAGFTLSPAGSALALTVNTPMPSINLSASGGVAPYTYQTNFSGAGTIPNGLQIANGNILQGTPTTAGSGTFSVRAFDANNCIAISTYTYVVNPATAGCPTITVNPTTSALTYTVNTPITDINLSASGGAAPYTYAISAGALPNSVGINQISSVISGTPTTAGNGTFTVRATDANGCTGTRVYTFTVNPAGTPVPPVIPPNPTTSIDNTLADMVKVSPNPSKGDFSIDLGKLKAGKSSVCVYDLQGKSVYFSENNANTLNISLEKFGNGMYLLEIKTVNERFTKRIVKQ